MPVTRITSPSANHKTVVHEDRARDVEAAYDKGRRDERAARKRHPFIMAGLFGLSAVGAAMLTLAAVNGSFTRGGAVADERIAVAAEQAAPVLDNAAAQASQTAREVGSDLKQKGADLVTPDKS